MQVQKVPAKKSFKVDELAKELGVKKFILKNWEKQFDLKKCGSDHKYSQEDFKIFAAIKNLIFIKKMPQSLAKKHIQDILAGKEFEENVLQEPAVQNISEPKIAAQSIAEQDITEQDITEIACKQKQELENITAEIVETTQDEELVVTTFQGAHEDIQNEGKMTEESKIADNISQIDFIDKAEDVFTEESIQQESLSANSAENLTDIKPALQEKEAFIKNIQSFKEQLLKIHDQLK